MEAETEENQEIDKNYVLFDFTDALMTVCFTMHRVLVLIKNDHDTIQKNIVIGGMIIEDHEKIISNLRQIKKIVFDFKVYSKTNLEIFKKMIYELNATKITIECAELSILYDYLQYSNLFMKIDTMIITQPFHLKNYYAFQSLGFGQDNAKELIQNILDICCSLIEKEIISQIEISNWGTDPFHISDNVRAVCPYSDLVLTLGKQGETTGQIDHSTQ